MSRAYDNAADGRYQQGGRRNLIINGAMEVAQRGTSAAVTTSSYFVLDRWITYPGSSGGAATVSQESFTVGQTDVPGEPQYFLKHNQTTGGVGPNIQQRIEGVRLGAGQSVTLSFYSKVTSGTLSLTPIIRQNFGSGGSSDVNTTGSAFSITTEWQKFEQTFTLPSISGKTVGVGDYLGLRLTPPDSTTFEISIAQVQLELGNVATPFEHRSYGEELALCQRYYNMYAKDSVSNGNAPIGMGHYYSSSLMNCIVSLPVTMRSNPTLDQGSGSLYFNFTRNNGSDGFDDFYLGDSQPNCVRISNSTDMGGTAGEAGNVGTSNSASYLAFDAEL